MFVLVTQSKRNSGRNFQINEAEKKNESFKEQIEKLTTQLEECNQLIKEKDDLIQYLTSKLNTIKHILEE